MIMEKSEIVRALHVAVFGTEPGPDTLETFVDEVGDNPLALAELASRLYRFAEHVRTTGRHTMPDHSQNGELRILLREMMTIGKRHGLIVDVGVLGRAGSNSYDLLTSFGWRGVLIEANPALMAVIERDFGPADFALIECAIGPVSGRQVFHLGPGDAVSSLIETQATGWGTSRGEIEVDVRRLHDVLDEAHTPHDFDILDLDIEGMDVAVMNDLIENSAYRPRLVVIEASYFFSTKSLDEVGLSAKVCSVYQILDKTASNLILGLIPGTAS